jgi:hypothetical protein
MVQQSHTYFFGRFWPWHGADGFSDEFDVHIVRFDVQIHVSSVFAVPGNFVTLHWATSALDSSPID